MSTIDVVLLAVVAALVAGLGGVLLRRRRPRRRHLPSGARRILVPFEGSLDQTVLDALRASNIDIPSDCEEGLCGSCEAPVLDGEVDHRDMVPGSLRP